MEFDPSNVDVITVDVSLEDLVERAMQREMLYYSKINDKFKKPLRDGDPHKPPREGKCPINDLPDELLSYVFQIGVETEREDDKDSESSDEDEWEDVDDEDSNGTSTDGTSADGASVNSSDVSRALSAITEPDMQDDHHGVILPFQVLVTHVCRRWRSVALDSYQFWTVLAFHNHPRLAQAKEYISRSNGLPLTIELDCSRDDDTSDTEDFELSNTSEDEEDLSLDDLGQILDLLEPVISRWGTFVFHSSGHDYVQFLMSRLDKFPSAPCLESFQVHIYEEQDHSVFIPASRKIHYLPFHGQAPNLKDAVFWGVHIDWEGALPNFLRGLRNLELSFLMNFERPTYATFAEIVKNSPELRTLTLSEGGPILPDGVTFDSVEAWGSVPLAIPSLTELALRYHEPKYVAALVQHLDVPNVTHLLLDFDEEDYSGFIQTLTKPTKGRDQSLLRQISHLSIWGLPCSIVNVEALLSQLVSLRSLDLKIYGPEEEVIYDKLVNPRAQTMSRPTVDLPKFFCPKLEEITTTGLDGRNMKALIIARRDAGVPLKRVRMAKHHNLLTDDELWIRENVEELSFYQPSDSDSEEESESDCHGHC